MFAKIKDFCKFSLAYILSLFLKRKNIWIITERRDECKDNGYHLFKYIRTEHPEINAYYAINSTSNQRCKISYLGNIIDFNSFKHYVYALAAVRLIGAFLPCGIPDSMSFYKFNKLIKGKKIFLQHGITKEEISSLKYPLTHADLFICGAKPEFMFVKDRFEYPEGNVKYTGLARYDALNEFTAKKQILLMPTWRQYLNSQTWGGTGQIFNQSDYFTALNNLTNNPYLHSLLEKYNTLLIFYPHHEVQGNLKDFNCSHSNVIIASENDYDVQSLLKESALLITDYSSVAYDFAYMGKPIVYYQFDEDTYYDKHYKKGYFDYTTMGFGEICHDINSLMTNIAYYLENDFHNDQKYLDRTNEFFEFRDSNNCQRIFEEINKL